MTFTRSFPLIDIQVRSGGDGRTVEAYAAVWDTPVRISDQQGKYNEQIARTAFNKTVQDRGSKPWPVIFNHGLTLHGTPSAMDTMPIGASVEPPRPDGRGLVTVAHYHAGERGDMALEGIASGAISAYSFSGRFIGSMPRPAGRSGRYMPASDGSLTTVTRTEIAMNEFGPAVFAAYPMAAITGVRAAGLDGPTTALLQQLLTAVAVSDAQFDPFVDAIMAADGALDATQMILAQILGQPDPDPEDEGDDESMMLGEDDSVPAAASADITSFAVRLDAALRARVSGTPTGAATDEPGAAHSGRLIVVRNNLRAALIERGIRP